MAARFWVGGTGTWDSAATTHWSTSTGGASGASAPTSADDATFDANSGLTTSVVVTIAGTAACNNLTISGPAVKVCTFTLSGNFTISGTLTLNGNSAVNRLLVQSNTVGTQRTITLATLTSLSNVDFADIKTAGGAGTWTGTSLGDCQGNSGITFDAPTTQTYTDTGSHSDNWSTLARWTSRVPLPQDNVLVPLGSTGTITGDMPRLGANVSFAGFTGTLNQLVATTAYGNWTFGTGMTHSGGFTLTLAGRGSQTFTSNSVHASTTVIFASVTGTYTLQDDLFVPSGGNCTTNSGSFNTNGKNVTCWQFFFNPLATLTITNSTITCTLNVAAASFSVAAGATVNASGSNVVISTAITGSRTFAGGGHTYGTLTYTVAGSTGALVITGANTFAAINFSDTSNARTLTLPASTTTTISSAAGWLVNGTAGKLMTVNSSSAGTAATLSVAAGTVTSDYLSVTDSTASGGGTFYAGANSTLVSNTSGWIIATAVAGADTAASADAVSAIALGTQGNIGDLATGVDALSSVALGTLAEVADAATGSDTASRLGLTAADLTAVDDEAAIAASAAAADTTTSSDAPAVAASVSDVDSSALLDAIGTMIVSGTGDAAAVADAPAALALSLVSDSLLLTDTVVPLIPIDGPGDAGSADEMARLFDSLTLYETAAASDDAAIGAETDAVESATAVDATLPLLLMLTLADDAVAADAIDRLGLDAADVGALAEQLARLQLTSGDGATALSAVVIAAIVTANEAANAADQAGVALPHYIDLRGGSIVSNARGGQVVSKNRGGAVTAVTRGGEVHA